MKKNRGSHLVYQVLELTLKEWSKYLINWLFNDKQELYVGSHLTFPHFIYKMEVFLKIISCVMTEYA